MNRDQPFLMQLSDAVFLMLVWIAVLLSIPFIAARNRAERRVPEDLPDFGASREHFESNPLTESRGR
jgi:hypothetical protein